MVTYCLVLVAIFVALVTGIILFICVHSQSIYLVANPRSYHNAPYNVDCVFATCDKDMLLNNATVCFAT